MFFLYWVDKFLVLKICRNPKAYDEAMAETTRSYLYFVPILHAIFGIYMFGNSKIFN